MTYGDNLPDTICEPCLEQLRQIQKFRAQLQYSDIILREYFSKTLSKKHNDDLLDEEASKFLEGGDETEDEDIENNKQETSTVGSPKKVIFKLPAKNQTEPKTNHVTIKFHPKKTIDKLSNNKKTVKEVTKKGVDKLVEPKTNPVVTNIHPKKTTYALVQNEKSVEVTKKKDDDEYVTTKFLPKKTLDKLPQNTKSVQEMEKKEAKKIEEPKKIQPKKTMDKSPQDGKKDQGEIIKEVEKLNKPKVQEEIINDEVDELEEIRKFLNPVGSSKENAENPCDKKLVDGSKCDDETPNNLVKEKIDSDTLKNKCKIETVEIKTEIATDNLDTKEEIDQSGKWDASDRFSSDDEYFPDDMEDDERPSKRKKAERITRRNRTVCLVCEEDLLTPRKLTIHKRVAHNIKGSHECSKCGSNFRGIKMLRDHMTSVHEIDIQDQFSCNICFKIYHSEKTWRDHVKGHQTIATGTNTCNICEKKFMYPSLLTQHMKSHSDEKPFLCFYCGKGFRHQGQYDYHIREHMGDTPYKCSYCSKGFMSPGNLCYYFILFSRTSFSHGGKNHDFSSLSTGRVFLLDCNRYDHR